MTWIYIYAHVCWYRIFILIWDTSGKKLNQIVKPALWLSHFSDPNKEYALGSSPYFHRCLATLGAAAVGVLDCRTATTPSLEDTYFEGGPDDHSGDALFSKQGSSNSWGCSSLYCWCMEYLIIGQKCWPTKTVLGSSSTSIDAFGNLMRVCLWRS